MFQLPAAFRTFAYQIRHIDGRLRFGKLSGFIPLLPFGLRQILQTAVDQQQAFGNRLFRRCQESFVEPYGMGSGNFIQTACNFPNLKAAAKHLRRQQPYSGADRPGNKDLENAISVVIDGYIKILIFKRYLPCGALKLARALDAGTFLVGTRAPGLRDGLGDV